jgi:DNA polymerase
VDNAIKMGLQAKREADAELTRITGLQNPNSVAQLLSWLTERGYPFSDIRKDRVKIALSTHSASMKPEAVLALRKRLESTKTSVKKFDAMQRAQTDGRLRHMFMFAGAGRTNRWAGKLVQMQNLPRASRDVEDYLELAREIIESGDYAAAKAFFNPLDMLSSSIRSTFEAPKGYKFVVCDLNAIENRGLGWLARCEPILEVFRKGLDPYIAFATFMYAMSYEELWHEFKVLKKKDKRTNAKPAVLGAGYMLSGGELVGEYPDVKKTGLWGYAEAMGIKMTREEAHYAVKVFRETYVDVCNFWSEIQEAAMHTTRTGKPSKAGFVSFDFKSPFLRMRLPNGRCLYYCRPKIEQKSRVVTYVNETLDPKTGEVKKERVQRRVTSPTLTYEGVHQTTKKWTRIETHPGKLTENAVQAVSRDVLAECMLRAEQVGFTIVGHVHDEIITLVPEDSPLGIRDLKKIMSTAIKWADGFPLDAAGYEATWYKKD